MWTQKQGLISKKGGPLYWLRTLISKTPAVLVVAAAAAGFWFLPHGVSFGSSTVKAYAEALEHAVGPLEAGRIVEITVVVGQQVKAGDIIGRMNKSLLDAQRVKLVAELDQVEAEVPAAQEDQEARVTRGELWRLRARATARSDRAELKEISTQVKRLEALAADRMIPATEVEDRRQKQTALAARVATYNQAMTQGHGALIPQSVDAAGRAAEVETRVAPFRFAVRAQQAAVQEIDIKLEECTLRAPVDGIVSLIAHRPGDVVAAGTLVISIVTARPNVIVGSVPEAVARKLTIGTPATLQREGLLSPTLRGHVFELSPVVDEAPVRARPTPTIPVWGRRIGIALDKPEVLLPGEKFHVRF